jgi:hypothetical protein
VAGQDGRVETDLPYVDEHAVTIPAAPAVVWSALERYVASFLRRAERNPMTLILGTEPRGGFAVTEAVPPELLSLSGRHRFSRYRLEFGLDDATDGATRLTARSCAVFPGLHGEAYRTLVIRSRLHVLATNHLLRSIARSV